MLSLMIGAGMAERENRARLDTSPQENEEQGPFGDKALLGKLIWSFDLELARPKWTGNVGQRVEQVRHQRQPEHRSADSH